MNTQPLPAGWKWATLDELCREDRTTVPGGSPLANELPYLSLEHITSNSGEILVTPDAVPEDSGRSNTFKFDDRHILYGKLRPYLNKVALPESPGRCTTEAIPLLPTGSDREYLAWFLRRPETVAHAMRERTGSRMPRTDMKDLLRIDIAVPPLPEQKRIAAILNEQMAAVEKAKKAAEERLEAAQALRAAYLREVFEGEEAKSWPEFKFGDIVTNHDGKRIPVKQSDRREMMGQFPYYGASGIIDYVAGYLFEGEYLLIGEDGANLLLRSSPIAFLADGKFWVNNHAHVLSARLPFSNQFLAYAIESMDLSPYVAGSAQPKLTQGNLNKILLRLPQSPDQIQFLTSVIEDRTTGATLVGESVQQEKETIDAMTVALLRKAFWGEL